MIYDKFKNEVPKGEVVAYGAAEQLAYYSSWRTIYLPRNTVEPDKGFVSWKTKFNVRYAIVPETSDIAKHPRVTVRTRAHGVALVDLAEL